MEEAKLLFERAAEESVPRSSQLARDYSALMLLGKEMEEMRWFMVPYEAHLYLTGSCPPVIRVPFEPRDYTHGDWYSSQYLNEWNKHWNPHYWEETKRERELGEDPVIIHQWQWTIYPANRSPTHKIQLQPIRDKGPGGMREKKAFASMECLYSEREAEGGESPNSPRSSGYSSEGEEGHDTTTPEVKGHGGKRRRRKGKRSGKSRQVVITYGEDSRQGKKCVVM